MALEPRIMFDGAAVADIAHAAQDAVADKVVAATLPDAPPAVEVRAADPAQNQGRKEVAFIDTGVADYQTLMEGVRAGIEVVLIDAGQSGLAQMAEWGQSHSDYDAIHVLCHGSSGTIRLGADVISSATLSDTTVRAELAVLGRALTANGDLMIYGCSVAAGQAGLNFLAGMVGATGADVAASDDPTGAAALGGDWDLETATGRIGGVNALNADAASRFASILVDATMTFETGNGTMSGYDTTTLTFAHTSSSTSFTFTAVDINDAADVVKRGADSGVAANVGGNSVYFGWNNKDKYGTVAIENGKIFDLSSFKLSNQNGNGAETFVVTTSNGGSLNASSGGSGTNFETITVGIDSNFQGITWFKISAPSQVTGAYFEIDDIAVLNITTPVTPPTITSATYDSSTNVLSVTGANLINGGAIDETKLTLTGQGGATYTLTETGAITASSTTAFSITLNATDAMNVEGLLNKAGTSAVDNTTFNLAGAADWHGTGNADLTGNAVTVSNVQTPTVTSATYDASSGSLVLTGTNMVKASGATNDITANKITLTGEGGATYTLTDTANVEITSATSATLTLSATDKAGLNQIFNKTGTASTGGTTYNVAAADDWNTVITNGDIADATGNAVTVSNPDTPTITSATYNAGTGALVVTGSGFLKLSGATNDIDVSKLTLTGEGGATYTLTTSSVEITSGTAFTVTLNATDLAGINQILNKAGTSATGGTTYNLAGAEDWAAGAEASVNVADLTGNGITVSSPTTPTITSTAYDANAGTLVLTGTGFLKLNGATNDIVANKFTFTGEGGATYTLTDTANIEITGATSATLTLSATDKAAVNLIMNKAGTSSTGGTSYNVAAAEDWAAGAEAAVNVVDATSSVTVSNLVTPTVTSAAYDYATNTLVVTGTGFVRSSGAANDVNLTKLTLTGQGGATYTLTAASTDVEVDSGTQFTVTLAGADITNVEALLNANGTSSAGGTTYNINAAASFLRGDNAATGDATSGVTVSNWAAPVITSTTFDWNSGALVLTGTNFVNVSGATNDIVASKFTFTGEGGTYTLTDTSNVEVTSATAATITLSATDLLNVRGLLNKNGTQSSGAVTYNVAAADDWMAGSPAAVDIADATTGSTVSNVAAPTITSATYDSTSGVLSVTGTNLFKKVGATNDIDVQKLMLTGQGGGTYTINNATADVEVTSATSFTMTLIGADKTGVDALLDQIGTTSTGGTTYNLAGADAWLAAQDSGVNIADATNAVTVSIAPTITSATYDANAGTLVVTGANIQANGAGMDIDLSKLTLTGEGGATYTLTTSNVERDSVTQFTVTVNATDKAGLNQILNKTGTSSTGGTTFNIAAAADWSGAVSGAADATNAVTVSNPDTPTITSATYDAGTGSFVVTGTGLLKKSGAANDIDVSKFTVTGEGGETYTLTTSSVEITNGTSFTIVLSAADKAALNMILNKDGTSSTGTGTYNLAAAEDWAAGAEAAVNVADLTGNGITVSNVAAPTVTSATYDYGTGVLTVTGTGLLKRGGAANDIDLTKLTLTGGTGTTHTLTSTDVEVTSGTSFTVTLNNADKTALNLLLNKNGTASNGGTTYNLAAAGSWNRGSAVAAADLTGNGVTVSNVPAPVVAPPAAPPPPPAPPPVVEAPKPAPVADNGPVAPLVTVVRDNTPAQTTFQAPTVTVTAPTQAASTPTVAPTGPAQVAVVPAALTAPAAQAFQVAVAVKPAGGGDALVVNAPIRDTVIAEGNRISVTVPAEAFAHTKADATVTLTATRDTGAALPGWMAFNPQTGTFEGTPPPGFKGEVVVKVVARDKDGREAVQTFKIVVGQGAGNIAPGQGEGRGQGQGDGQGQPQGEGQGQPQGAPGRTGDAGHGDTPSLAKAVGRPSLTQQLRELSQEGRIAKQAALLNALKRGGKAA
jgi:hypothetical protein